MRIGIDIGGTKIDAVLLDPATNIRHRLRRPTAPGRIGVLDGVESATRELLAQSSISAREIEQLGIGIPGVVDVETGRVRHAVNLDIDALELTGILSERLGIPVIVENDVNAAALGAWHLLALTAPTAFLNLGTGLAAGIVVGGRVWRGSRGAAGEIGHIPVDPNGARCSCGQRGCLETVASGSALTRMWPTPAPLPARDLFDRAERGQIDAQTVRESLVRGVAAAVRVLLLTTDVETVVIGGGLSNLGERLLRPLQEVFLEWGTASPFLDSLGSTSRVRLAPGGAPVAAIGAALLERDPAVAPV